MGSTVAFIQGSIGFSGTVYDIRAHMAYVAVFAHPSMFEIPLTYCKPVPACDVWHPREELYMQAQRDIQRLQSDLHKRELEIQRLDHDLQETKRSFRIVERCLSGAAQSVAPGPDKPPRPPTPREVG